MKKVISYVSIAFMIAGILAAQGEPNKEFIESVRKLEKEKIVSFLESGVDPNLRDHYETPAFWHLLRYHEFKEVKELAESFLAKGADIDIREYDKTLLLTSIESGSMDLVKFLISHGADVNAKDKYGTSPLITLIWSDKREIQDEKRARAELLIANKADVKAASEGGTTALHALAVYPVKEASAIASLLISKGAEINARAEFGNTALILASANGYSDVVEVLLTHKANFNLMNDSGYTALMMAAKRGQTHIVPILKKAGAKL